MQREAQSMTEMLMVDLRKEQETDHTCSFPPARQLLGPRLNSRDLHLLHVSNLHPIYIWTESPPLLLASNKREPDQSPFVSLHFCPSNGFGCTTAKSLPSPNMTQSIYHHSPSRHSTVSTPRGSPPPLTYSDCSEDFEVCQALSHRERKQFPAQPCSSSSQQSTSPPNINLHLLRVSLLQLIQPAAS
jgi:hypothetical protein